MGNSPPTLDYAMPKPHARLKKWTRRIVLAALVLGCLYATPIAWLYWGWKQEQPAIERFRQLTAKVPPGELFGSGRRWRDERVGPPILDHVLPERLQWIRWRMTDFTIPYDAGEEDLPLLTRFGRLRFLELNSRISDAGLMHLGGMSRLRELSVYNRTDEAFVHIAHLTGLESLEVAQATDGGLANLRGLTSLRTLRLSRTQVTDAGLAHLAGLKELRELRLDSTAIGDAGLEHLKGLPHLEVLWLEQTRVTDAGLARLLNVKTLKDLSIRKTNVTYHGFCVAHETLTGCRIDYDFPYFED